MELIRRFPAELVAQALEGWRWLEGLGDMDPLLTTAFGDVFLQAPDGVWFLDTVEGSLTRGWDDPQSLQAHLNTPEGQSKHLMAGLVVAAHNDGLVPGDAQVLSFKVPPILGGQLDPANVEVSDLVVALSVLGQIHEQVKDLPPGTPVSGITTT